MNDKYFNAIKEGRIESVEQMLSQDLSLLSAVNENGMSGVVVAAYWGRPKIAELLVSRGARLDLFEASMIGDIEIVKKLLEGGPTLASSFSKDGFTALHFAAFFGRNDVAKILIDEGSDVNAVARNAMKVTPLHSAVARSNSETARLLISKGASVNARQEGGFTPLHGAAQNGSSTIARMLIENGADVNALTDSGKSPLDLTREGGPEAGKRKDREEVARLLIESKVR